MRRWGGIVLKYLWFLGGDTSDSHEITSWGEASKIFEECSIVIGLHPDQATEAIVDLALQWYVMLFPSSYYYQFSPSHYCMVDDLHNRKKPFAVIPCCVYHKEFPKRRFPDGTPISKYEDFVQYLIAKVFFFPPLQHTK
jgi:hypothetical protein